VDAITRRIEEARKLDEIADAKRQWDLRSDAIRKDERHHNYAAIKQAVQAGIERVRAELPNRQIEFTENPASYFSVRNPSPRGATVTVAIRQDGRALECEIQSHVTGTLSAHKIGIGVEGDETYFVLEGKFATTTEVAGHILDLGRVYSL
jgi:hypothetical protein